MQILRDVSLASRTSIQLGGPAQYLIEARSMADLAEALSWAERERLCVNILGGGSNLVVSDMGLRGLVLQVLLGGVEVEMGSTSARFRVAAGESWDAIVARSVELDLSGIECLSGIPGTAGATPIQNVGAYGQEVAHAITGVEAMDRANREVVHLSRRDCDFGYRQSRFKHHDADRFVITHVHFELERRAPSPPRHPELLRRLEREGTREPSSRKLRQAVLDLRRSKSMLVDATDPNSRSCGSFFVNPKVPATLADQIDRAVAAGSMPRYPQADGSIKLAAAWLIEQAGLSRGMRDGNVGLSPHHALAVVAYPGACAKEVVTFARRIRDTVRLRFGVSLIPEPNFWGFEPAADPLVAGIAPSGRTSSTSPG